jgi:hypothetical protein
MATQEEVYKYILKVENEEKVKTAAAAAALAEQKFRALFDSLGSGHAQTKAAADRLVDLNRGLQSAQASSRDFGRATLLASQGVEDLQYGVAAVLNNLPGLITSLGGGAGLAGVISLVAVGGKVLYDHWNDLGALFGQGHTRTEAEQMEELRKKTSLTADEAERLSRATQLKEKVTSLRGAKTDDERSEEEAASKAVADAGFRNVAAGLLRTNPELVDGTGEAAKAKAELDKFNKSVAFNKSGGELDVIRKKLELEEKLLQARRATAEELAASGTLPSVFPGGREKLAEAVKANPDAFGPGGRKLAEDLKAADPEAMREKAEDKHASAVEEASKSRLAEWQEKNRVELEESTRALEEFRTGIKDTSRMNAAEKELHELKTEEAQDRHQKAVEEAARNRLVEFQEKARVEARDKAEKEREDSATLGTHVSQLNLRGQAAALRGILAGGSRAQVTGRLLVGISRELRAQGVAPDRAVEMARDQANHIYGQAVDAARGAHAAPPQRIGVGDFARSVESAGKQVTLLEQQVGLLAQLVNNTLNIGRIRGGN